MRVYGMLALRYENTATLDCRVGTTDKSVTSSTTTTVYGTDSDGAGLVNALEPDSDDHGLHDGTELGLRCPSPDTEPGPPAQCIPDGDSGDTTTCMVANDAWRDLDAAAMQGAATRIELPP